MENKKCTKEFPKAFQGETNENVNGYPKYKRRDNTEDTDSDLVVRGSRIDNSWVVPYHPYLLLKYNCHINTEICASIKSIKYLFNMSTKVMIVRTSNSKL